MNIKKNFVLSCALTAMAISVTALPMLDKPVSAEKEPALAIPATITVVATGLNNPRGVNFGPDGALYVAEAGSGGPGTCAPGPEGDRCYGTSGSVARIDLRRGIMTRVASGIPSLAGEDGSFATGIQDISFNGLGSGAFTMGWSGDPADRTIQFGPAGADFARLGRMNALGNWSIGENLGDFEAAANPTGDEEDSNPYGILSLAGKRIVADAGANDLLEVSPGGNVSVLAVFPNRLGAMPPGFDFIPDLPPAGTLLEMDAVPTSVALGPDGNYYVGQLAGFPFPVNDSNVYRVPASGGTAEVHAAGFTAIIDVAFGPDGSMYVLEIAKNGLLEAFINGDWTGALIRVAPDGTRTEIAPGSLFAPGGVAIGSDGTMYVTNNSIFSGTGQVLRIAP
ncbi:MAG TPA: ScyD/ScyE family protein [Pyrinomonadaceae bacterium]|nr:ScyD/ScyE family protein [Pyrinomonadaceae bacterium]